MVKLQLAFVVGFCYVVSLWFYRDDLHASVAVVLPFWLAIALRGASFYALLLYLACYLPQLRVWLLDQVRRIVESEEW
jgi:hypothetical protein